MKLHAVRHVYSKKKYQYKVDYFIIAKDAIEKDKSPNVYQNQWIQQLKYFVQVWSLQTTAQTKNSYEY